MNHDPQDQYKWIRQTLRSMICYLSTKNKGARFRHVRPPLNDLLDGMKMDVVKLSGNHRKTTLHVMTWCRWVWRRWISSPNTPPTPSTPCYRQLRPTKLSLSQFIHVDCLDPGSTNAVVVCARLLTSKQFARQGHQAHHTQLRWRQADTRHVRLIITGMQLYMESSVFLPRLMTRRWGFVAYMSNPPPPISQRADYQLFVCTHLNTARTPSYFPEAERVAWRRGVVSTGWHRVASP